MDVHNHAPVRDISPRAWDALCDVGGGEDRIDDRVMRIAPGHFTTEPLAEPPLRRSEAIFAVALGPVAAFPAGISYNPLFISCL